MNLSWNNMKPTCLTHTTRQDTGQCHDSVSRLQNSQCYRSPSGREPRHTWLTAESAVIQHVESEVEAVGWRELSDRLLA